MFTGFWSTIQYPIVGLAPMDGVTDAAFRAIAATHGKPDLIITEFTSAEGIRAGAVRLLDDFLYSEQERPIVAQLFGSDPDAFFIGAAVASCLGFDGIDINMGCPSKSVTGHGAGAALIRDPERAKAIVAAAKAGTKAWNESRDINGFNVPPHLKEEVVRRRATHVIATDTEELPVSVKTRVGYDQITIGEWMCHLLETEPVAVTVHGRTLKQLYTGESNWEAIREAVNIAAGTPTKVLGNGDAQSKAQALKRCAEYGVDGVLIGRAAFGNPWLFAEREGTLEMRLSVALEHARIFSSIFPEPAFVRMRKHLLDYLKGFEGAKELRIRLMRVSGLEETEKILLDALG